MAAKTTLKVRVDTALSPYGLAGWITRNSEALGLGDDYEIAPQRMYQYTRSGKLETNQNELGHKVVTPEAANAFVEWFVDPNRKSKKAEATEATETE